MIPRDLVDRIVTATPPKAVVIFGPRRVGKTTLIKSLPDLGVTNFLNGDRRRDVQLLQRLESAGDVDVLLNGSDTIVIDEAQRVPNIGLIVKMLVDANEKTKIFLTGSSSLELAQGVRESAVGRLVNRRLWSLSLNELANEYGWGQVATDIERLMVYGTYPEWKNLAKVTGFSLKRERPRSRFLGGPFSVCLSAWKVLGRRKWGGWECLEGRRPKGIPILPRREAPAAASPACRRCRSRSLLQFAKRSAFQLDHVAVVE